MMACLQNCSRHIILIALFDREGSDLWRPIQADSHPLLLMIIFVWTENLSYLRREVRLDRLNFANFWGHYSILLSQSRSYSIQNCLYYNCFFNTLFLCLWFNFNCLLQYFLWKKWESWLAPIVASWTFNSKYYQRDPYVQLFAHRVVLPE